MLHPLAPLLPTNRLFLSNQYKTLAACGSLLSLPLPHQSFLPSSKLVYQVSITALNIQWQLVGNSLAQLLYPEQAPALNFAGQYPAVCPYLSIFTMHAYMQCRRAVHQHQRGSWRADHCHGSHSRWADCAQVLIVSRITQCLHASTRWQASVKAWQLHLSPILQAAVCNTTQAAAAAGTVEVDAHTTVLSLFGLLITLTAWGIGCASTIRIGNLLGAGHVQQARLSGEQPGALPAKQPA